jgi:hypothetical protein
MQRCQLAPFQPQPGRAAERHGQTEAAHEWRGQSAQTGASGFSGDKKSMEAKATHTLEELREAAREQNLRIEEKHGKYRVVRTLSGRFGLIGVNAGAGFSLNHNELRQFLIFDSKRIDIGARITDWS